jgi:hypothetical protein
MNSGYFPNVVGHKRRIQTESDGFQAPFYFGGSQVPVNLELSKKSYNNSFNIVKPDKIIKNKI